MADFCNKCAEMMGFPEADEDFYKLFDEHLKEKENFNIEENRGTFVQVLCEGCGATALIKYNDEPYVLIEGFFYPYKNINQLNIDLKVTYEGGIPITNQ